MKKIREFEDYLICKDGRVYSTKSNIYLKPFTSSKGYSLVNLPIPKKNKNKFFLIHRLVAEYFIDNPNSYKIVRHLDGNPKNNNVLNLAWGNSKMNMEDARGHQTLAIGSKIGISKLNEDKVSLIKQRNKTAQKYAKEYGVTARTIEYIWSGKTWKHVM